MGNGTMWDSSSSPGFSITRRGAYLVCLGFLFVKWHLLMYCLESVINLLENTVIGYWSWFSLLFQGSSNLGCWLQGWESSLPPGGCQLGQWLSYHIRGFLGAVDTDGTLESIDPRWRKTAPCSPQEKMLHITEVSGWATDQACIVL